MNYATWSCECGAVEARVQANGSRVICYCSSCRDFVERLGKGDTLAPAGGSDLLQVAPEDVAITKGAENLRYLKLSPKGPMRWYASCCNAPMVNTLPSRAVAFASFQVPGIMPQDAIPKVGAKVNLRGATAHVDGPKGSPLPLVLNLIVRTGRAWITGSWKKNPFFDETGKPIAARQDI